VSDAETASVKTASTGTAPARFCGIDTGEHCALAVRERGLEEGGPAGEGGPARWIYFEAPPVDRLIARCRVIFEALGVRAVVIDGGPHTTIAREVHDLLPGGAFIWRHTEGAMSVKDESFMNVERRQVRLNREELLNLLVEEFREGPGAVRWPTPQSEAEEALLETVESHLMNLRKTRRLRAGGEEIDVYGRGENHFGFACAYARLAEALAETESVLTAPAGGTLPPHAGDPHSRPGGNRGGGRRGGWR
jgi:hypothetical protein